MTRLRVCQSDDLEACLRLRRTVFVEEQNVPAELEFDTLDPEATHLLAYVDEHPVGTARILDRGGNIKIGRVCVLATYRGQKIGVALIEACHRIGRDMGARQAHLSAQLVAKEFYSALGYRAYGDVFDDAGIPHIMMKVDL